MTDREELLAIHSALDDALGDSDVTHVEDDDELREEQPVQWAAQKLMEFINRAGPAATPASEPTEAMLNAARDWSVAKYGRGIGNDAAIGCWKAMLAASVSRPNR